MSNTATGTVIKIMDLMTFDSGFTKKEFVIETDEKYQQKLKFETVRDKTALCDKIKVGDYVTIHYNVMGNEYKDRYYVNLACWRVEIGSQSANQPAAPASAGDESEDLPPF